jgi:hypothetical protein
MDPDPHQIKMYGNVRIWINLHITSQNEWNMSLFDDISKVFSLYLEARIRIRIKVMQICNGVIGNEKIISLIKSCSGDERHGSEIFGTHASV